jgi:hypothetical protein
MNLMKYFTFGTLGLRLGLTSRLGVRDSRGRKARLVLPAHLVILEHRAILVPKDVPEHRAILVPKDIPGHRDTLGHRGALGLKGILGLKVILDLKDVQVLKGIQVPKVIPEHKVSRGS